MPFLEEEAGIPVNTTAHIQLAIDCGLIWVGIKSRAVNQSLCYPPYSRVDSGIYCP